MYGFDAISAHNGWAMAITGALIVMTGLTVLFIVISQLHKIAALLEKKGKKHPESKQAVTTEPQEAVVPKPAGIDLEEAEACLKTLAADLGETFKLTNLYNSANRNELPHVHLSIRSLREAGVIIPAGEGRFAWRG